MGTPVGATCQELLSGFSCGWGVAIFAIKLGMLDEQAHWQFRDGKSVWEECVFAHPYLLSWMDHIAHLQG